MSESGEWRSRRQKVQTRIIISMTLHNNVISRGGLQLTLAKRYPPLNTRPDISFGKPMKLLYLLCDFASKKSRPQIMGWAYKTIPFGLEFMDFPSFSFPGKREIFSLISREPGNSRETHLLSTCTKKYKKSGFLGLFHPKSENFGTCFKLI